MSDKDWTTRDGWWTGIGRQSWPHVVVLQPKSMDSLTWNVEAKVATGQGRVVSGMMKNKIAPQNWKIPCSPWSLTNHVCSEQFLDLSSAICLAAGKTIRHVNETTEKTSPQGAVNQLDHSLTNIIHEFAEADDNAKICMAKLDINDGFWRLDCQEG